MTTGTSQGLFVTVTIVIFGIFVAMTYLLFQDKLQVGLTTIFDSSIEQTITQLNKEDKKQEEEPSSEEYNENRLKYTISPKGLSIISKGKSLTLTVNDMVTNDIIDISTGEFIVHKSEILSISNKGVVTGISNGTTTIYYKDNNNYFSNKITINIKQANIINK